MLASSSLPFTDSEVGINLSGNVLTENVVDGLIIRVPPRWVYNEEEVLKSGSLIRIDTSSNIMFEAEITEVFGRPFKLSMFSPIEFELWRIGKPSTPMFEKLCDWKCSLKTNLTNTGGRIYIVFEGKGYEPEAVLKGKISYYEYDEGQDVMREYDISLPILGNEHIVLEGSFRSNLPIKFSVNSEEDERVYYSVKSSAGDFLLKLSPSKSELKRGFMSLAFVMENEGRETAEVRIWARASWKNVVKSKPIIVLDKEKTVKLAPLYTEDKVESFETLVKISNKYYWGFSGVYSRFCPKGFNYRLEAEAVEPSGLSFRLIILDDYNWKILKEYSTEEFHFRMDRDPSGVFPRLNPIYFSPSSSKINVELRNLTSCINVFFLRDSNGTLSIKWRGIEKWIDYNKDSLKRETLNKEELIATRESFLIIEGGFEANQPVRARITVPDDIDPRSGDLSYYYVEDSMSGSFHFSSYSPLSYHPMYWVSIIFENSINRPAEVRFWIKGYRIILSEKSEAVAETSTKLTTPTTSTKTLKTTPTISNTDTTYTTRVEGVSVFKLPLTLTLLIVLLIALVSTILFMSWLKRRRTRS